MHLHLSICTAMILAWPVPGSACEPPIPQTEVVGRSVGGELLLRVHDRDEWIQLEAVDIKNGRVSRVIPILERNDPKAKRAELRRTRWTAAQRELGAAGFTIDPVRFESLRLGVSETADESHSRRLTIGNGIELFSKRVSNEAGNVRGDLVLRKGDVERVVEEGFIGGGFVPDLGDPTTLVGGFHVPEHGALVLMTQTCSGIWNYQARRLPALLKSAQIK